MSVCGQCVAMSALLLVVISVLHLAQQVLGVGTSRPVIGILCQEEENPPDCYIAASYVKAVEAAGARVAPVFISRPDSYYRSMVKNLNGFLFPGGEAVESTRGGYYDAARTVFAAARSLNYQGDHFPILGVCLGLEFLALFANLGSRDSTLEPCPGMENVLLPLDFEPGFKNSSLYRHASQRIVDILTTQNVTPNYHDFCLRPETKLRYPWRILSTNKDSSGRKFVSSMETEEGPMAAIQFHPEKNAYEWQKNNARSEDAQLASRHFYDWLVVEARMNDHSFPDNSTESAALIYNYYPRTGDPDFTQIYYFKAHPNGTASSA